MPPPAAVRRHRRVADRQARRRRQVPDLQGAGGRSRPVRQSLRRHSDHEGPLHQGDSDAAGDRRVAQGRAPRAARTRSTIPTPGRRRRRQPGRRRRAVPRRVRLGQERRGLSGATTGVLLQAGKKAMVELSPALDRRGVRRPRSSWASRSIPKGYVPKHIRWSKQLAQPTRRLDIPAGTVARIDGYTVLHKPARIIAFQPHMHIRGKRQCLELIYPTSGARARSEVVNCANFNYNWHLTYNYTDDVRSRSCPQARSCTPSAGTTTRRPTRPTRIRRTGSATVSARSTRWDSRGSAGIDLTDEEYKTAARGAQGCSGRSTRPATTQQQQQQQ